MRSLVLLTHAAALLALGACGDGPAEATSPATVEVRGVFIQSMYDGDAMLVNHEAIPNRMPAMRMAFRLYTPALLDSVAEGARVRLTLDSASLEVLDVETLPFDTALELEPGNADGTGTMILPPDTE